MFHISHRGNLNKIEPDFENSPDYIMNALNKGFDVEIDIWEDKNGKLYLGHDEPQYFIKDNFIINNKLWCHAKNIKALRKMIAMKGVHCFWHQNDDVVLTSKGYIWTYPGKKLTNHSIAVLPENVSKTWDIYIAKGICSDYIMNYIKQE